jgi:hypothetical protein
METRLPGGPAAGRHPDISRCRPQGEKDRVRSHFRKTAHRILPGSGNSWGKPPRPQEARQAESDVRNLAMKSRSGTGRENQYPWA